SSSGSSWWIQISDRITIRRTFANVLSRNSTQSAFLRFLRLLLPYLSRIRPENSSKEHKSRVLIAILFWELVELELL
ncbi:MAG: hypothetical protein AAF497_22850, partial [Planctomycetota bacterium]